MYVDRKELVYVNFFLNINLGRKGNFRNFELVLYFFIKFFI